MNQLPEPTTDQGPIRLVWDGTNVSVTPEDQERLGKEARWAMTASQNGSDAERFWQRFETEFLKPIHQWCAARQDRVGTCYVSFSKDHLRVFVVRRSQRYDFTLSDELSNLEMDLFEKQWLADIIQIPSGPPSVLEAFFKPGASIQVYANSG